jgi:hypothetical protein
MPKFISRRWNEDDIAKLRDLAQKRSRAEIAAQLGRGVSATVVKAHKLKISLSTRRRNKAQPQSAVDPRQPSDIELRD